MKDVMLGYWVILVGIVFDVVGILWDAIDALSGLSDHAWHHVTVDVEGDALVE